MPMTPLRRLAVAARLVPARLRRDTSAVALTEFAFALPILLTIGMFGVEESNIALTNLRVSQYALALADNASRVGVASSSASTVQQLREVDINDVLQGTRLQGTNIKLTIYGRVTLSSLENVQQLKYDTTAPVQRIHWQRCIGLKAGTGYDSTYGAAPATAGTDDTSANAGPAVPTGMGDANAKVTAPAGSAVMFVEINYDYQPLFTNLLGTRKIHYIASFIVRDNRDFSQVYNPVTAAPVSNCSLHAA